MTTRCIQSPGFRRRRLIYAHATAAAKAPGPRPTTRLPPREPARAPHGARRRTPRTVARAGQRHEAHGTRRPQTGAGAQAGAPGRARSVPYTARGTASRTGRRVTRGRAATSGGTPPGRGAAGRAPSRWGARGQASNAAHREPCGTLRKHRPIYLWHVRSGSRLVVGRAIRATTRRRVVIDRGHRRPYLCLLSRHSHVSANSRRGLHFHATCRVHGYTRLRLDPFDNGSIISMP